MTLYFSPAGELKILNSVWSTRYRDHFRGVHNDATQALLCHKEPAQGTQSPLRDLAQHHYELLENDLDIEWTTLILGFIQAFCKTGAYY